MNFNRTFYFWQFLIQAILRWLEHFCHFSKDRVYIVVVSTFVCLLCVEGWCLPLARLPLPPYPQTPIDCAGPWLFSLCAFFSFFLNWHKKLSTFVPETNQVLQCIPSNMYIRNENYNDNKKSLYISVFQIISLCPHLMKDYIWHK